MPLPRDQFRQRFRAPVQVQVTRTELQAPPIEDLIDVVADGCRASSTASYAEMLPSEHHMREMIEETQTYADLINVVEAQIESARRRRDEGVPVYWDRIGLDRAPLGSKEERIGEACLGRGSMSLMMSSLSEEAVEESARDARGSKEL
jgi:hypothetical protein